jgi:hypothetical protein
MTASRHAENFIDQFATGFAADTRYNAAVCESAADIDYS